MDYTKIYKDLVYKAKQENRKKNQGIYYEAHHIIPKCMGGEGCCKNINHPNIVLFTFKEHLLAHKLLCKIYPQNKKLQAALYAFIRYNNKKLSLKEYEKSKIEYMEYRKENPRIVSDETRKKISIKSKGRVKSQQEIEKLKKPRASGYKKESIEKQKKTMIERYGGKNIKRRKFNEDDASLFLSLLNDGWSLRKIALEYNADHSTIKNTLIRYGKNS